MTLDRRRFLGVIVAGVVSTVSGCLDATDAAESATTDNSHQKTVTISDGEFTPSSLEAAAGHDLTVVFENQDDHEHPLRSDFRDFEMTVPASDSVSKRVTVPDKPGDYEVGCGSSGGTFTLESVPADVLSGCSLDDRNE